MAASGAARPSEREQTEQRDPKYRPVLAVAGNKTDLTPREVPVEEGELWAARHDATHYEVSAYSGRGVGRLFDQLFQRAVRAAAGGRHGQAAPPAAGPDSVRGRLGAPNPRRAQRLGLTGPETGLRPRRRQQGLPDAGRDAAPGQERQRRGGRGLQAAVDCAQ